MNKSSVQFSSIAQSCPTLCNPMDCSTPGFPVHHQPLELAQTRPSSRWYHPTISSSVVPFSACLQSFPASRFFPSDFFASGSQSIGASISASVLPVNIQDWFPSGLTGLISLQSKGLSKNFSITTIQKLQFFTSGGQSIGASISASVLPMNIQDCFPLGLTGLISLQSKGLSITLIDSYLHEWFWLLLTLMIF